MSKKAVKKAVVIKSHAGRPKGAKNRFYSVALSELNARFKPDVLIPLPHKIAVSLGLVATAQVVATQSVAAQPVPSEPIVAVVTDAVENPVDSQ